MEFLLSHLEACFPPGQCSTLGLVAALPKIESVLRQVLCHHLHPTPSRVSVLLRIFFWFPSSSNISSKPNLTSLSSLLTLSCLLPPSLKIQTTPKPLQSPASSPDYTASLFPQDAVPFLHCTSDRLTKSLSCSQTAHAHDNTSNGF